MIIGVYWFVRNSFHIAVYVTPDCFDMVINQLKQYWTVWRGIYDQILDVKRDFKASIIGYEVITVFFLEKFIEFLDSILSAIFFSFFFAFFQNAPRDATRVGWTS